MRGFAGVAQDACVGPGDAQRLQARVTTRRLEQLAIQPERLARLAALTQITRARDIAELANGGQLRERVQIARGALQAQHLAVVLDGPNRTANLYVAGQHADSAAISGDLNQLADIDNWLGRSHLTSQPGLNAAVTELRIYNRPLTAQELALTHSTGPNPIFLDE